MKFDESTWKPKILGFLCNWCSYAGADLAGVSRIQYPPNIRIIRLMCSGRVEPFFIFESLMQKIDGIIIMGCHLGDCHYMTGNHEALHKYDLISRLLKFTGMEERVKLEWVSAAEGIRFGQVVTDFSNHIQELGPSPVRTAEKGSDLLLSLTAIQRAANSYRLRVFIGRKKIMTEDGNVYDDIVPLEKFEAIEDDAILAEYQRHKMLLLMGKESLSVESMAEKIQIDKSKVLEHVTSLRTKGLIELDRIKDLTPLYMTIKTK